MPKQKGKRGGRKGGNSGGGRAVREKSEEGETYAAIIKVFGGANAEVVCEDGKHRLCVIRGAFRGRNKRDNFLAAGVWVLVGLRDWCTHADREKMEKCDLLCVYREDEKSKLKANATGNWSALGSANPEDKEDDESGLIFDDGTGPNEGLIESIMEEATLADVTKPSGNEPNGIDQWKGVIDIDEI